MARFRETQTMVNVESLYHEVGQNIKAWREQRGLTQEALASQVSLTRTSITNIEKGRQKLLLHTLIDIATALGTHPASLLPRLAGKSQDDLDTKLDGLPAHTKDWIKTTVASLESGM